jgi:hypothetical protein
LDLEFESDSKPLGQDEVRELDDNAERHHLFEQPRKPKITERDRVLAKKARRASSCP